MLLWPQKYTGQRGRSGAANQPHGSFAPFRVDDLRGGKLQMRNFAGGENGQHASAFDPRNRFAKSATVRLRGTLGAERVHENAVLLQFGYVTQQKVRYHFDVGTHAGEKNGEDCAIEHAERVVSNHYHGACGGDTRGVSDVHAQLHAHLSEKILQLKTGWRLAHTAIEIANFRHWKKFSSESV